MNESVTFDTSRFDLKIAAVKKAVEEAAKEAVDFGMSELAREAIRNLAGQMHKKGTKSPSPGKLPVTMITGNLHRSIKQKRVSNVEGVVYVDKSQAPYGKFVHDGTKYMKPRRFMTESVQAKKESIIRTFDNKIREKVKEAGGA